MQQGLSITLTCCPMMGMKDILEPCHPTQDICDPQTEPLFGQPPKLNSMWLSPVRLGKMLDSRLAQWFTLKVSLAQPHEKCLLRLHLNASATEHSSHPSCVPGHELSPPAPGSGAVSCRWLWVKTHRDHRWIGSFFVLAISFFGYPFLIHGQMMLL